MKSPPAGFPRMSVSPKYVDALAWYDRDAPGIPQMVWKTHRNESIPLAHYPASGGEVGVPRTLAPAAPHGEDMRSVGIPMDATFTGSLRPKQEPFVDALEHMLRSQGGGIGEAPTGFGKTVCGIALAMRIGVSTCIVVPKSDLDWATRIRELTSLPDEEVGIWRGQFTPHPGHKITVASLQSVYREGYYPAEMYARFGLVIFDEVHRLGAPELGAAVRQFPAKYRLGLSATPERRDGKMAYVQAHLGWGMVSGSSAAEQPDYYVIPTTWKEPVSKSGKAIGFDPAKSNYATKSLIADTLRNSAIANAALRAHKGGRRSIVFVSQIAHAEALQRSLRSMGVPEDLLSLYTGKSSEAEREKARECKPGSIMIATYKFTAEGTDIPRLDVAILAYPIYDPRQAVGRILRTAEGKPTPVVIDVVDEECGTLRNLAHARRRYLLQQGATWKGRFG